MKKLSLTFVVLFLAATTANSQTTQAPSLVLKDIRGRSIRLSDFKGKVVLVNFWATWCPPCRTEIPDLVKKQSQYRDQGLRIIGITYPPERLSDVRRFARRMKMNYPVALGTKKTKGMFTSSETLPITVVIDRDGKLRDTIEGIMYQDEFDRKVKPLLGAVARP